MRYISYTENRVDRAGALIEGAVFDVAEALAHAEIEWDPVAPTMRAMLETFGGTLATVSNAVAAAAATGVGARGPVGDVALTSPVSDPHKVLCIGLNYADHVAETGRALPEYPDVFTKFATSLIGPREPIGALAVTDQLDFEGELAIVIGKTASNVSQADAESHIAGVMVLNDITARDLQYRGTQWVVGKSVDASTPSGSELVTLDEVGDVQNLEITTRLNGEVMQHSNTKHMIFPIAMLIEYLSRTITLQPGDIIATGTPDGIGAKRTPPVWLRAGDVLEVELEKVGTLVSHISAAK